MPINESNVALWAREIELRREIVAAMRLRTMLRMNSPEQRGRLRPSASEAAKKAPRNEGARGRETHCTGGPGRTERCTRIVLISDYEGLRYSRALLLRKQGYDVKSTSSLDFLAWPDAENCDVALLCQSIESDRALFLSALLRRTYPDVCLLRVRPVRALAEPEFDLCVDGFDGPAVLLEALQTFIHRQTKSA